MADESYHTAIVIGAILMGTSLLVFIKSIPAQGALIMGYAALVCDAYTALWRVLLKNRVRQTNRVGYWNGFQLTRSLKTWTYHSIKTFAKGAV